MANQSIDLGRLIKQQRRSMDLTLAMVGKSSRVSVSYLGSIENWKRFPSARILRKIAKPLGFEEIYLLTLAGFLSPAESKKETEKTAIQGVDPYVAMVLAQESVEVQRTVIGILTILKLIAKRTT